MKNLILPLLLLFVNLTGYSQSKMPNQKVLGKIQKDGSVKSTASDIELNSYLTTALNNMGIEGSISKPSIIYLEEQGYWVIQGAGYVNGNKDKELNIRVQLEANGGTKLKIMMGGTTESCNGDPCEECDFAPGGGCKCLRTSSSQVGLGGICNHSKTKTSITKLSSQKTTMKGN